MLTTRITKHINETYSVQWHIPIGNEGEKIVNNIYENVESCTIERSFNAICNCFFAFIILFSQISFIQDIDHRRVLTNQTIFNLVFRRFASNI